MVMASWIDILGIANCGFNNANQLSDIFIASVCGVDPILFSIGSAVTISKKELVFSSITDYLKDTKDEGLIDKKFILIKAQGGQKFFVLLEAGEN